MRDTEIVERIGYALGELEGIDLRGKKKGTVVHDSVVAVKEAVTEAYDALVEATTEQAS